VPKKLQLRCDRKARHGTRLFQLSRKGDAVEHGDAKCAPAFDGADRENKFREMLES
jgi:hypothetical protein